VKNESGHLLVIKRLDGIGRNRHSGWCSRRQNCAPRFETSRTAWFKVYRWMGLILSEIHAENTPWRCRLRTYGQPQTATCKTAAFLIAMITDFSMYPLEGKTPLTILPRLLSPQTREVSPYRFWFEAVKLNRLNCHLNVVTLVGGLKYEKQKCVRNWKTLIYWLANARAFCWICFVVVSVSLGKVECSCARLRRPYVVHGLYRMWKHYSYDAT